MDNLLTERRLLQNGTLQNEFILLQAEVDYSQIDNSINAGRKALEIILFKYFTVKLPYLYYKTV